MRVLYTASLLGTVISEREEFCSVYYQLRLTADDIYLYCIYWIDSILINTECSSECCRSVLVDRFFQYWVESRDSVSEMKDSGGGYPI